MYIILYSYIIYNIYILYVTYNVYIILYILYMYIYIYNIHNITVKVSYCWTQNIASIIKSHNKKQINTSKIHSAMQLQEEA